MFESEKPLILDGAIGTYLISKGYSANSNLWASGALIDHEKLVENIHNEYLNSGSEIITTNTFGSNPSMTKDLTLTDKLINSAFHCINSNKSKVFACNPPAEDCYQVKRTLCLNDLLFNHYFHIDQLIRHKPDVIICETFSHFDEIIVACKYLHQLNYPYIMSLYFLDNLTILSGESVNEVIEKILNYQPLAISFNCIKPNTLLKLLSNIDISYKWGFYLNAGKSDVNEGEISEVISPEEYSIFIKDNFLKFKPSFIGGCCGTTPQHIRKLKEMIDGIY